MTEFLAFVDRHFAVFALLSLLLVLQFPIVVIGRGRR